MRDLVRARWAVCKYTPLQLQRLADSFSLRKSTKRPCAQCDSPSQSPCLPFCPPQQEYLMEYSWKRRGTAALRRRFRFRTANSVAKNHKYDILQKHFIPNRPNPDSSCCPPRLGAMEGTLWIVCSGHTLPRVRRQPVSKR